MSRGGGPPPLSHRRPCRGAWLRFTFPAVPTPVPTRTWPVLLLLATVACGGKAAAPAGPTPASARPPKDPVVPLLTSGFAGQTIAVAPLTLILMPDSIAQVEHLADRATQLRWADSLLGLALEERGPEVKWVLPPELRKTARRAPGIAPDPDRMGQAILRVPNMKDVPDPLRSQLRSLVALNGGRFALVPAALAFTQLPDGAGLRAEFSLALADTRTGKVVWRTLAWGDGPTPTRALGATFATVFPTELQ